MISSAQLCVGYIFHMLQQKSPKLGKISAQLGTMCVSLNVVCAHNRCDLIYICR